MPNLDSHDMAQSDYRSRIYDYYVHSRLESLAPPNVEAIRRDGIFLERMVEKHFPPHKNAAILDLGCGYGSLIYHARRAGYVNVVGVDRSPQQVAEAKRLGIEGVTEGDILDYLAATPDETQDVVLTFDVIEHFTRDELLPFVDEVRRVLKDGGLWIIHTPNGESPLSNRIRYGDLTHEQAFTRTSLGQLLLSSGFRSVECYEDTPVVRGAASAVRYLLWKTFRGMLRLYLAAETGNSGGKAIFTQNLLAIAVR
ncbi:MAG: class I SAM-dependent methyltransferase [Gemmatimonadaceae bacterium]